MTEKQKQFIRDNYLTTSDRELSRKLQVSLGKIDHFRRREQLKRPVAAGKIVTDDVESLVNKVTYETKQKEQKKSYEKAIIKLSEDLEEYKDKYNLAVGLNGRVQPTEIKVGSKSRSADESVAVVIASDWHYEEIVTKKSTNGLNEFSLQIADRRINAFFVNLVRLLKKESEHATINTLVLALIGDFITNWNLHDDTPKHCALGVFDALSAVENHLIGGIQYILDSTTVDLVIPTSVGNHSRTTKKIHITTEEQDSVESIVYAHIARHFRDNKRVKVLLPESYLSYVTLWDTYTICFHHGHAVNYGGGVGGLTIPMLKAIAGWDRNRKADLYVCGHFHQQLDGGKFMVNGSLIGYNAYAQFIKASAEPASQWFFLVNKEYNRKTITAPIFLE